MRVLVVEDNEGLAFAVQCTLESAGHTVTVAYTGACALEWLAAATFDVVSLDLMLPDRPGTDVLTAARALGGRTRVLVVSARPRPQADALKADGYLAKPFGAAELLGKVDALGNSTTSRSGSRPSRP